MNAILDQQKDNTDFGITPNHQTFISPLNPLLILASNKLFGGAWDGWTIKNPGGGVHGDGTFSE